MLVNLSIIPFSNSHILPIMLTDFTYYSKNMFGLMLMEFQTANNILLIKYFLT